MRGGARRRTLVGVRLAHGDPAARHVDRSRLRRVAGRDSPAARELAAGERCAVAFALDAKSGNSAARTVVATLPGRDRSKYILFCAHGDSDSGGPGANDNASGVAIVLEIARSVAAAVKSGALPQPAWDLRFASWGGEISSTREYAAGLEKDPSRLQAVFNYDQSGFGSSKDALYVEPDDVPANRELVTLVRSVMTDHVGEQGFPAHAASVKTQGGTDSYVFQPRAQGATVYPAVTLYTSAWDKERALPVTEGFPPIRWYPGEQPGMVTVDGDAFYHSVGDTPANTTDREPGNMGWCARVGLLSALRLMSGEVRAEAAGPRRSRAIMRSMQTISRFACTLGVFALGAVSLLGASPASAQAPTPAQQQAPPAAQQPPDPAADALRAGQQLMRDGKADEALAAYLKAVEQFPTSVPARIRVGVQLDLMGRYAEARTHFEKALAMPLTPAQEASALRSMAMAYAFENNCKAAIPYESRLYERYLTKDKDFYMAGEIANELARVCLEAGDYATAEAWYKRGYEAGLQEPNISAARKDLWEFRWQHAQARLAARRGDKALAGKHVAAAKAALDTGTNPDQAPFFPYLVGYVAFYSGDYKAALAEFAKGNQNDPFVLSLIAQSHEKLGDQAAAMECYKKVMTFTTHNPNNAFARPLARKKLGL